MFGRPGDCKQLFRAKEARVNQVGPISFLLLILLLIMILFIRVQRDEEHDQD